MEKRGVVIYNLFRFAFLMWVFCDDIPTVAHFWVLFVSCFESEQEKESWEGGKKPFRMTFGTGKDSRR